MRQARAGGRNPFGIGTKSRRNLLGNGMSIYPNGVVLPPARDWRIAYPGDLGLDINCASFFIQGLV